MPCLRSMLLGLPFIVGAGTLTAQTADRSEAPVAADTFRMNARTVVEDVVVLDKNGAAVPSLRKEDFQIFEDGKPQAISFFEANFADTGPAATPVPLPPNTFTNVPTVAPNQSINVLLMDALNTPSSDQMYVHLQMVKYLASLPPGVRIGVFMLSERLRMIQGVTQDSNVLREAIAKFASKPAPSDLLPSAAQTEAQNSLVSSMKQMESDSQGSQLSPAQTSQLTDSADALRGFLEQESRVEDNARLLFTLDSLQVLARYLAGIPGRKNLIWFVGDIPYCSPDKCPYSDTYHETQMMLAAARVSVYPIGAKGAEAPGDASDNSSAQSTNASDLLAAQNAAFAADNKDRGFRHINMDTWAEETGGKAHYDTNGLKDALADDVESGSRYYTLAYVPKDTKNEGRERKIDVKVAGGTYKLYYRRSYLEQTQKQIKVTKSAPVDDPLRPLMDRGLPSATEIPFRLKVVPSPVQPGAGSPRAGENAQLSGNLTRYIIGFQLPADSLSLVPDEDGARRRPLEVAVVVYSHEGKPLNWEVRNVNLLIKPEQWAMARTAGIPFHLEIDAPPGDVYLRTGVYDLSMRKAGTLEVPLTAVTIAGK